MLGRKIKKLRDLKNYTQEYMANQLNISQNSYSRIESENVKVTAERLKAIAQLLEVPSEYLISDDRPLLTFNTSNNTIEKFYGHVENLSEQQKDFISQLTKMYENQIKYLQGENERLMGIIEKMMK
jgi:transcriptional regulator with XRE-family HTH domain